LSARRIARPLPPLVEQILKPTQVQKLSSSARSYRGGRRTTKNVYTVVWATARRRNLRGRKQQASTQLSEGQGTQARPLPLVLPIPAQTGEGTIPDRFVAARTFGAASLRKKSLSVVVVSLVSSVFSTWLPIVPILGVGVIEACLGTAAVADSFLIVVPLVAIAMGIETAFIDTMLFRMLLKESGKEAIYALLIANIFNASIALALGLAWAFHHLPIFEATVNGSCSP
jgi:hypothetical protein